MSDGKLQLPSAAQVLGPIHPFDVVVIGSDGKIDMDAVKVGNDRMQAFHDRWDATHVVQGPSLLVDRGNTYVWLSAVRRDLWEQQAVEQGLAGALTQYHGGKELNRLASETVLPAGGAPPPRGGGGRGGMQGVFGR